MESRAAVSIACILLVLVLALVGCASGRQQKVQSMDRTGAGTRGELEELRQALDAAYDRERSLIERLHQAEETSAQLRQDLQRLHQKDAAARAYIDSLKTIIARQSASRAVDETFREFDARAVYESAREHYQSRRYQVALERFAELLDAVPYSEWADNAQYWRGECYYGLGKYRQALTEFTKVFAYQKTEKADDAQLKIAYCYLSLGEMDRSLEVFQRLLDEYPESEYVPIARKMMKQLRGS